MRMVMMSFCVLFVCLYGCTHSRIFKETGADFPGISKRISPSRPLQILVVHGMGIHDETYAEGLLVTLSEHVGLRSRGCLFQLNPIRHPDYEGVDYGSVNRCTYKGPRGQDINVYILTWSPLTRALKKRFLGYDWMDKSLVADRLPLNHGMKELLFDKSLSDALLYAGPFRSQMQYSVQQALCLMMREHRVQNNVCTLAESFLGETNFEQIVVIAQGLGGTMVFQTVEALYQHAHDLTDERRTDQFARAAARFAADTTTMFMLANPWPLLSLGDMDVRAPRRFHSSIESFIRLRYEQRRKNHIPEAIQIVAFSDPNDVLSYPIPESGVDDLPEELRDQVLFSNVLLTIADVWFFGTLADPVKSHTGYAQDPTVIKLIGCGSRTQATC
jgi:hypothetical protein